MADSVFDSCRQCGSPRHSILAHDRIVEAMNAHPELLPLPTEVAGTNIVRLTVSRGGQTLRTSTIAHIAHRRPEGASPRTFLVFEVVGEFSDALTPIGVHHADLRLD